VRLPLLTCGLLFAACTASIDHEAPGSTAALGGRADTTGPTANAMITPAVGFCQSHGATSGNVFVADPSVSGTGTVCSGIPNASDQIGKLVVNVRMTTQNVTGTDDVARLTVKAWNNVAGKTETFKTTLHVSDITNPGDNVNLAVSFNHQAGSGGPLPPDKAGFPIQVETLGNGALSIEQIEIIPDGRHLVIGPGSKELAADDQLRIETALGDTSFTLAVNGSDVTADLASLIASTGGTDIDGGFRHVRTLLLRDLVDVSSGPAIVTAHGTNSEVAQFTLRAAPPACNWEGDPSATVKVLISGFEPFPIGSSAANASQIAVQALDPTQLPGVQIMRVTLPVEFDSAGNELASIIARCAPSAVISFGVESGANNIEVQAHDAQSSVGADNRGILRWDTTTVASGPTTLPVTLPTAAILAALAGQGSFTNNDGLAADEYICNDVAYHLLDALAGTGIPGGFVHLASQPSYGPDVQALLGGYVQTIVQATVASLAPPKS
jgi:pyroglutamyl-peptidase